MNSTVLIGILLSILGLFIFITGLQFPQIIPNVPGPGFFPIILGILLVILSIVLIFNKNNYDSKMSLFSKKYTKTYLSFFVAIIYIILLNILGFILATIPFLAFMIWLFGYKNFKNNLLVSISVTIIIFIIFNILLNVPLPRINL